jgi:hypothetical protein
MAINAWIEEADRKYRPEMEVTGVTETAESGVIGGLVPPRLVEALWRSSHN